MTYEDLIITIIVSLVTGMAASSLVSEHYRQLYIYKEIVNYAKETELYFREIEYEAKLYMQTGDIKNLEKLLDVREVYRKDEYDINDVELVKSIQQCNSRIYELSEITENDRLTFERKVSSISLFDFYNPFLDIHNARVLYEVNEYKRILKVKKNVTIVLLIVLVATMVIVIA